jgi:hypothetical protein
MRRIHRQAGVQRIESLLKNAGDASHPVDSVFDDGILAQMVSGAESFGVDPSETQDKYIQQLRTIYDKYLAPFHGRGAAAENPPKVVSVPK